MVDSVGSSGQISRVSSVDRTQKSEENQKSEEVAEVRATDEVKISEEALLAQVEATAKQASDQLSKDQSATLSPDIERLSTLV
ncbi:MAG: hypothetical protein COB36_01320 [Alphaproteobacteria bacterium]|nr:MAG: hypothetical protein COB36_01320 [Alphaproteobacteria bacterium]